MKIKIYEVEKFTKEIKDCYEGFEHCYHLIEFGEDWGSPNLLHAIVDLGKLKRRDEDENENLITSFKFYNLFKDKNITIRKADELYPAMSSFYSKADKLYYIKCG